MAAKRYSVIFYAAIIVALISTFGVYRVLEATKASARVATAPVVIAQKDMAEGAGIDRMAVVVAQWPVGTIPAGAFTTVDSVAGRVTRVPIFKGEALVPGRLAPEGTGPGLEVKITPGKRAVSFRVNDVSGISGLIQPNSRVDIVTVIDGGAEKGRVAKVFMENMRILAMNQVPGSPHATAVATVEVTPAEAERLAIAMAQGQIQLMLRGYGDPESAKTKRATASQIVQGLNNAAKATPQQLLFIRPQPRKPDTNTVTIYRQRAVEQKRFRVDSAKRDSLRARQ
jgi:pilus assembly protein CpaB